jgi:hypothetical protein
MQEENLNIIAQYLIKHGPKCIHSWPGKNQCPICNAIYIEYIITNFTKDGIIQLAKELKRKETNI